MDARTWTLVRNTLLLVGATCAISLPLGSVLAWLLARTDLPGRRLGMGLLGLMLLLGWLGWRRLRETTPQDGHTGIR